MLSKIGFVLFMIGCAGIDGNFVASTIIASIGLVILLIESKKIDVTTDQSRNVYK